MRNDLISLVFSNNDGSEVTIPAVSLLQISSALEEILTIIGVNQPQPFSIDLEIAAADRGSLKISFKWIAKKHDPNRKDFKGLTIDGASKLAQTVFHIVSTVSVLLVISGYADWTAAKQPHADDIKEQMSEAQRIDNKGIAYDAAGKLVQSLIHVRADNVSMEVPSVPSITIVGMDTKYGGLLASKPQSTMHGELVQATRLHSYRREILLKVDSGSKIRASVNGEEQFIRTGSVEFNGHMYKVIIIWQSTTIIDDMMLPDMPPYSVSASFYEKYDGVKPIEPVTAAFRNADGFIVVHGVKKFE